MDSWVRRALLCVLSCGHCLPVSQVVVAWQAVKAALCMTQATTQLGPPAEACLALLHCLPANALAAGKCYIAVQACLAHIQLGAHSTSWSGYSTADPQHLPV